jgi:glycosyltransferase involved in cell wall biosynthesis
MKKFSVIIPHYNSSQTLSKCLHSVFDQDWPEKEVIVVFDGKDKTAEMITQSFKTVITANTPKERSGAPVARNIGAGLATGDYILFLDADSYLNPGALRSWAEGFDKNPEASFLYSGYKILANLQEPGFTYPSNPFDQYHLERYNFIDTSNPIKKEALVKWDEELKSLQDWEFWLRVCKNGHKGHYLENNYFVEKEPPKKQSISQDSHDNWIERRSTIQKKHNLPTSEIAVTSDFPHHGYRVAKLIGADFADPMILLSKPHNYKLVYRVGNFPENGRNNFLPYYDNKTNYFKKDLVKVIQWIGTDILHTRNGLTFSQLKDYVKPFNDKFIQYCQSEQNLAELTEMGFNAKLLTMPVDFTYGSNYELPEAFTVAIYDHGSSQEDIYCQVLMRDIIISMPDINFVYFGSNEMKGQEKNIKWLGKVSPIDKVIKQSSCLLRITKHDGFPVTPIEFLNHGRPTITNVRMKHTFHVDFDGVYTEKSIPQVKKDIIRQIRYIKNGLVFDYKEAKRYYMEYLNPNNLKDELNRLIKEGVKV